MSNSPFQTIKPLLLSLRPKQWIKNFFIFLPLIFGKKLFIFPANLKSAAAFFIFSLSASAIYLINDVMDIEKDKLHPIKRLRPIASGKVTTKQAKIMALTLGMISISASFALNTNFGLVIIGYLIFNLIYTKILKEIVIIDVVCIASFFLLRIIAGSIVTGVNMSYWIIIVTVLLALFLGFNKRRQEIKIFKRYANHRRHVLSKYSVHFIDKIIAIITSLIVIIYPLYTLNSRTLRELGTNHLTYSIPFVYYGIFRYIFLIHKVHKDGDPTHILLSDRKMQFNLAMWVLVCILVIYFGI